jgi:DNA (cytosine-5)-methyltransferase 1
MGRQLTAIDLFSGCGGLTEGLKQAGFKVLCAIEIDLKARETYTLNHPDVPFAGLDIREVASIDLLKISGLQKGELDLLAGCPPCQGFSSIRRRNKSRAVTDKRNDLIEDFSRITLALLPKLVMLENVPRLIEYRKFQNFVRALKSLGYKTTVQILDVADFGVPQRRKRLILAANRIGDVLIGTPSDARLNVKSAIGGLAKAGKSGDPLHDALCNRSPRVEALIAAIPKNGGSRSSLPSELQLKCHRNTLGFGDVYGRMSWENPSPTITGGCGSPSKGRFLHPNENRVITLREAALLQGFPSNYQFDLRHGKDSISLMIGNALPPPFIARHALAMAGSLGT